jgi:hypothetical protein
MKKILFITSLFALSLTNLQGQYDLHGNYDLNFDDEYGLNHLQIDTLANPSNIWQIGIPKKGLFTTAKSSPNAIVTDITNPYPINDTSSFIITNVALGSGFEWPHTVILSGCYYVNSDSLTDYGKIEFSPDNGKSWIDLLNDTFQGSEWEWDWYFEASNKPILTGNSDSWECFWVNIAVLGKNFNINYGDTVLYRFTFISDSIQTNKSGLMFDNLHFEDWMESDINKQGYEFFQSVCYPNPTMDRITIKAINIENSIFELELFDNTGKMINHVQNIKSQKIILNTKEFDKGIIFFRLVDKNNKKNSTGKFILY